MKHIKLFEDYSEEELKDLIGDLKSVGLSDSPVLGEDYGFTSDLLKESPNPNWAYNVLFTPETVEYMVKNGMAEYGSDQKKYVYFFPKNKWDSSWGSYGPGNYKMEHSLHQLTYSKGVLEGVILYVLIGKSGDYGFGINTLKKVGTKARLYCQNQFLEKFKKFIDETH
jgi:hypothetical protein